MVRALGPTVEAKGFESKAKPDEAKPMSEEEAKKDKEAKDLQDPSKQYNKALELIEAMEKAGREAKPASALYKTELAAKRKAEWDQANPKAPKKAKVKEARVFLK